MLRSTLIKKIMWALMPTLGIYAQFSFLAIWDPNWAFWPISVLRSHAIVLLDGRANREKGRRRG